MLKLYTEPDSLKEITDINLFRITFDGTKGGAISKPIYIRNDDKELYYSNITLTFNSLSYIFRLVQADYCPTVLEWSKIPINTEIALTYNIGSSTVYDISTYITVWSQVTIPRGESANNIDFITLKLGYTEGLVT